MSNILHALAITVVISTAACLGAGFVVLLKYIYDKRIKEKP